MQPTSYMLLRIRDVERITGLSRSHLYRRMKSSEFPRPRIVAGCCRWRSDEIQAWLDSVAGEPAEAAR